ncbi:unnamed protein product, partial [marine sediment metagenome]
MKNYKCDKCGLEDFTKKYYEIKFMELPNTTKIIFDLCEKCYNKFRKKNR